MKNQNINFGFVRIIVATVTISILFSCSTETKIEIADLLCEYIENPLGIDIVNPRLSWNLKSKESNIKQKAYRILASKSREKLANNVGDLWDSDTVYSDKSNQIIYHGRKLTSREKVFWKVRVWDQNNNSSGWSNISSWEMGLIKENDWNAKWIGKEDKHEPKVGQNNPAPYFRKSFKIGNNIKNARVYICGLGYYELYINGKKVGDHVLSPNQTNYDRRQVSSYENEKIANMSTRVLYLTYDISTYLQEGKNVVAVVLGNGWYYQTERSEYIPLYFDTPRLIAQIEINKNDGSQEQILSDKSWKVSTGPILNNNIFHGEIYDARLEDTEWNKKEFDEGKWESAKIVRAPEGKLHAQMSPPDRVIKPIKPVQLTNPRKGVYRYDFGTMFSGWVKLKIKGERGSEIIIKYFEDSGNTYGQTDTYILKGGAIEEWKPRFTWHSFRYIEVESSSINMTMENIMGEIVHTDVKTAGIFESSNKLFNRIVNDYKKTQIDNMHGGVTTDCPHRERRGYTGDGQIAAQAAIYNFDMRTFYTKWLNDIADAQNIKTGYIPNTVPYHSGGGGVAWGSAYIIIPWYMFLYYGDDSILNSHYEGMKKYVEYLGNRTDENGLIYIDPTDTWDLGEWVPPGPTVIPRSLVASAYYYYDLTLISKMAKVIGKQSDVTIFNKLAKQLKDSFNQKYYNPKQHIYSIGYQGANVFPLAFGLVPEKYEQQVFESLVKNIEIKNNGHFDTGMLATPYVLEVLTKYGRADLAYTVMNRRDYPSYGYNIDRGATTLWETWTGNESHSHPMFGSVTAWFYQSIGGINPDPNNPGFRHIILSPNIVNDLDFANTTFQSIYGEIKSEWEYKKGDLKLNITIPPNTTASVMIPGTELINISSDNSNLTPINIKNNIIRYEIPSGEYTFYSKNICRIVKSPMISIPKISPTDSTLFIHDSVKISISQFSEDAEIRYTVDGSEPTILSKLFTKQIVLKKNTVIKAKVFKNGYQPSYTSISRITFIDSTKNGVNYKYYVGAWEKLPNFKDLTPKSVGKVYNFDLEQIDNLADKFALEFISRIKINRDDTYTFYLMSNDGSKLFIDDKLVIDFDGLHGSSVKDGSVKLDNGLHKIKVEYFQAGGGKGLELFYQGPDMEKQKVPATNLIFIK